MTKKRKIGIAAFALPILLFLIIMIIMGQYPFGDDTLMILDMNSQYHTFFVHLRDILHGDASPWYSFSRALGGDMLSVAAYYLISPFNLLFYFFNEENIYVGITIVMLLKLGTMGWTMNYYLCRKKITYTTLIFSTAFALSAYVVAYGSNIMWLDGLIILPIMVLGIERLVDEGKYLMYLLSIAYAVISNFYIGYMLCLFSVVYFLCYYFLLSESPKRIRPLVVYAGSSLLGGALSAVVSIPTVYAMQDGKGSFDLSVLFNSDKTVGYGRLAANSFLGMIDDTQLSAGSPLIYAGILTVIFAVFYFGLKEIAWKKKLAYGILFAVMIFSIRHYNMCYIWQGFNVPNGAFFRFSFLYIFLILVVANEAAGYLLEEQGDSWKKKVLLVSGILWALVLLVEYRLFALLMHRGVWLVNAAFLLTYLVVLFVHWNKTGKTIILLILMSLELCVGAMYHFHYAPLYQENAKVSDYNAYMDQVGPLVETVKEEEGMFRTVLAGGAYRTPNDNFLFNLYGLDSYTSLEQNGTQEAAFQFGYYRHMVFGVHYREGTTHAAESLLGVKYLISDEEPEVGYYKKDTLGSMGLYENQTALPFAMFADETILTIDNKEYDTFRYQNEIYASLTEEVKNPVFNKLDLKVAATKNCVENADGTFSLVDTEKEAYVELEMNITKAGEYYLQYMTSDTGNVTAFIDGESKDYSETVNAVKQLGYLTSSNKVVLRCYLAGETPRSLKNVYVYQEDETVLEAYAKAVNATGIEVSSSRDDKLKIVCNNENEKSTYLLLTIPMDAGWHISVDGADTPIYNVLHNLMAISVEPGSHVIEMYYIPRGLKKGIALTGISLLILFGILGYGRKQRRGE